MEPNCSSRTIACRVFDGLWLAALAVLLELANPRVIPFALPDYFVHQVRCLAALGYIALGFAMIRWQKGIAATNETPLPPAQDTGEQSRAILRALMLIALIGFFKCAFLPLRSDDIPWLPVLGSFAGSVLVSWLILVLTRSVARIAPEALHWPLAAYALGMFAEEVVSHVYQIPPTARAVFTVGELVSLAALLVTIAKLTRSSGEHTPQASNTPSPQAIETHIDTLLASLPLAHREAQAARALLAGLSSTETAQAMGIKPSTVRAYLIRVYKKCGVANAEEFKALLLDRDLPVDGTVDTVDWPDRTGTSDEADQPSCISANVVRALALGVIALALLPFPGAFITREAGQGLVCLAGLTCLLVAAVSRALIELTGSSPCQRLFDMHAWEPLLIGAPTLAAIPLVHLMFAGPNPPVPDTTFVLSALAACGIGAATCTGIGLAKEAEPSPRQRTFEVCAVAVLCASVAISTLSPAVHIAALALFTLGFGATAFRYIGSSRPSEPCAPADAIQIKHNKRSIVLAAAAATLGVAVARVWGDPKTLSPWSATMLPLAVLAFGSLAHARREAVAAVLAGSLVLIWLGIASDIGVLVVLTGVCILAVSACLVAPRDGKDHLAGNENVTIGSLGTGIVASCWLVSRYGGIASIELEAARQVAWLLTSFSLLLVGACLLVSARRQDRSPLMRPLGDTDAEREERMAHYLRARGLNETQVAVLLGIVQGQTASAIADTLGYSRGTVNSARLVGYRALGVRSRRELIDCITAGIGL